MGQRSRATIDQTWEKYYLQDRQFRTSCRSKIICQFWKQFVFYNATTRIVGTWCTPVSGNKAASRSSQIQYQSEVTNETTKRLGQESLKDDKKDADDPLADLPFWLQGFHRQSRGHRIACTREHSSRLRFGTSYESGDKIEEAQHFVLTSRKIKKLRCLLENQNNKKPLAEDALSKLHLTQKSLVTW